MAYVNIPRHLDDLNYRYKMPRLFSKIEGRGNGIKTNISNMGDIAKALKRPPMYVTKFFGCELGAMAKFEEAEEKAIINGAHREENLVLILDKFIEMYVLCGSCRLPEMDMNVKKGSLTFKCNACGSVGVLDISHKAATYMIRNPPADSASTISKKKTSKDKKAEKVEKSKKSSASFSQGLAIVESDQDKGDKKEKKKKDKISKDEKEKPAKLKKKKQKNSLTSDEVSSNSTDDITPVDNSKNEALAQKKKKKDEKMSSSVPETLKLIEKLTFTSPAIIEVIERMRLFLKNSPSRFSPDDFYNELRLYQVSQDFDSKCRFYVALSSLFENSLKIEDLERNMIYLRRVADSSTKCSDIISPLEHFIYNHSKGSLQFYPYIVQKLYCSELISTDDILKYYSKENNTNEAFNQCKKYVQPFLIWLSENKSEEEESDEEEDISGTNRQILVKSLQDSTISKNHISTMNKSDVKNSGEFDDDEFHDAEEAFSDLDSNDKANQKIDNLSDLVDGIQIKSDEKSGTINQSNEYDEDFDIDDI